MRKAGPISRSATNAQMLPCAKGSFIGVWGQAPQENFMLLTLKTLFAAPENGFSIELINKDITNDKSFPKEMFLKYHMVHFLMPSTALHKNRRI